MRRRVGGRDGPGVVSCRLPIVTTAFFVFRLPALPSAFGKDRSRLPTRVRWHPGYPTPRYTLQLLGHRSAASLPFGLADCILIIPFHHVQLLSRHFTVLLSVFRNGKKYVWVLSSIFMVVDKSAETYQTEADGRYLVPNLVRSES